MDSDSFRFLTDENIDPDVVQWIRQRGHDVKDIKEEKLSGAVDITILDTANKEKRIVITHDSDFGKIIFSGYRLHTGIIFLRPGHINARVHIASLTAVFSSLAETVFPFMLVAENSTDRIKIRIRNL